MSGARHRRTALSAFMPSAIRSRVRVGFVAAVTIDIYTFGREAAPLVAECKARGSGGGFVQLERWLGEYDLLFLRRNNADALVLVPWRVWRRLLTRGR
jgi:hypothetical protein